MWSSVEGSCGRNYLAPGGYSLSVSWMQHSKYFMSFRSSYSTTSWNKHNNSHVSGRNGSQVMAVVCNRHVPSPCHRRLRRFHRVVFPEHQGWPPNCAPTKREWWRSFHNRRRRRWRPGLWSRPMSKLSRNTRSKNNNFQCVYGCQICNKKLAKAVLNDPMLRKRIETHFRWEHSLVHMNLNPAGTTLIWFEENLKRDRWSTHVSCLWQAAPEKCPRFCELCWAKRGSLFFPASGTASPQQIWGTVRVWVFPHGSHVTWPPTPTSLSCSRFWSTCSTTSEKNFAASRGGYDCPSLASSQCSAGNPTANMHRELLILIRHASPPAKEKKL